MPGRIIPLITGEYYHVFNRGINHQPVFYSKSEYQRFITTIRYYHFRESPMKLSYFLSLSQNKRKYVWDTVYSSKNVWVKVISYCLMPNHFHLLVKQEKDNGTAKLIGNLQNSYTRFFNIRNKRDGSLFLDQFKAVRIETNEQLLHVNRYIHLNPFTGRIVKEIEQVFRYPWSSLMQYVDNRERWVNSSEIVSNFRNISKYSNFLIDQADYQKKLSNIKHLLFEYP
jgi:putative transposase